IVAAAGLVGLNGAVDRVSQHALPRQLVRAIDASAPVTDLFVGNSLAMAVFDPSIFERSAPGSRAFNAGLGATYPVEHDILLTRALRLQPSHVYYGVFDRQLTDESPSDASSLIGNRALDYYIDPELAMAFLGNGKPFVRWRLWLGSK